MADSRDSRNYGHGRRLIDHKTRFSLGEQMARINGLGSKSIEQAKSAFKKFAAFAREEYQIQHLERVTPAIMAEWMEDLREQLRDGDLCRSTTSSYVGVVNQVMRCVGREDLVLSADKELSRGQKYTNKDLANSLESRVACQAWLMEEANRAEGRERLMLQGYAHSDRLQLAVGLRLRESCLVKLPGKDADSPLLPLGKSDGTKNGRDRLATVLDQSAVREAREFVITNRDLYRRGSLVPHDMSWREYRRWVYGTIDRFRAAMGYTEYHAHGGRHAYAQQRFADLWMERTGVSIECPAKDRVFATEWINATAAQANLSFEEVRQIDREIRLTVSGDLGHGRIDIVSSYLGK
jgi:hypothetical protein